MTRILIIDDDADVRDQIASTLLAAFYETYTATDGRDGIIKALRNPPDLIICDMVMPNLTGQEVLVELRNRPETATVPFIFLTAIEDRSIVRESMNLGADDYLFKPFQSTDLINTVNARLKYHQQIVTNVEQQMEALKLRLARTITHELRTPLAAIIQVLEVLSRQSSHLPAQEVSDLIETMGYGTNRLTHCIEQMVLATQLTTGVLSADSILQSGVPMLLGDVLNAAITLGRRFTTQQAPDVNIKLNEGDEDPRLLCNPIALKHGFAEVIANALAFSPAKGTVRIIYKPIEDGVRLTITDSGPGIPNERLQEALSWFTQLDRDKVEQQGIGMGLPLASQLMAIHGGSLDIRSILGKGTQVIIVLPIAE